MADDREVSETKTLSETGDTPTATASLSSPPGRPHPGSVSSVLHPGRQFGPYRIVRLLGKGGMGEVYEAEHRESSRRVALKVLSQALASPSDRDRFLREGRLAASISHPHCVYIFGSEEIEGMPAISMELLPGGTLKDRVKRKGLLAATEATDTILQVIAGLEAAQEAGILHRDIKPANCFVQDQATVKIGDFGLSISTLRREESRLTTTGSFLGTPAFASPEQLGGEELDVRSDIYSIGATLYYLLTGQPPFNESNLMKLLTQIGQQQPESPSRLRAEIPRSLSEVILRCLQKDPRKRFADYARLREALAPFSSAATMPAGLLVRLWAGLIDWTLLTAVGMIVSLTFLRCPFFTLWLNISIAALNVIYSGIGEGLWGGNSLGKRILGIRVTAEDRFVPGPARALLRSAIYSSIWLISNLLMFLLLPTTVFFTSHTLVAALPFGIGIFGLLAFLPAHRDNRWAGIHELLSRTRVAVKPHYRPRSVEPQKEKTGLVQESAGKLGPYAVIRELCRSGAEVLHLGYDPMLRRNVWIHRLPIGSAAVSETRRDLNRPGRLRWLSGRRSATESWDAYEAPEGRAFVDLLDRKTSWGTVRHWMHSLAVELESASKEGTIPAGTGFDYLWIGSDGGMKLTDFPIPAAREMESTHLSRLATGDLASIQEFLGQVAFSALQGEISKNSLTERSGPKVPLPPFARSFLENLNRRRFDTFESILEKLKSFVQSEPSVSRRLRAEQIGFYCLLPLFFLLFVFFVGYFAGLPIRSQAPEAVARYIRQHGLYAATEPSEPREPSEPGETAHS